MRIANGRVVSGKVVFDDLPFEDGASVTVIAEGEEDGVAIDPEQEVALRESIAQIRRGEFITAEELFARLSRNR